jgi:hypothetical protein
MRTKKHMKLSLRPDEWNQTTKDDKEYDNTQINEYFRDMKFKQILKMTLAEKTPIII